MMSLYSQHMAQDHWSGHHTLLGFFLLPPHKPWSLKLVTNWFILLFVILTVGNMMCLSINWVSWFKQWLVCRKGLNNDWGWEWTSASLGEPFPIAIIYCFLCLACWLYVTLPAVIFVTEKAILAGICWINDFGRAISSLKGQQCELSKLIHFYVSGHKRQRWQLSKLTHLSHVSGHTS